MLYGTLALSLCIAIFLYGDFLTGKALFSYTVSDAYSQYLPIYKTLARRIASGNFSLWNPSIGFGEPQAYTLLFYPLNLIPILLGAYIGDTAMIVGFAWMQVVKIILAALFTWLFLNKLHFSPEICSVMSLVYALNGILILRGNWRFPADECFLAMMFLWALERYFCDRNWHWIPPCIYLLGCCLGAYGIYLYALLTVLYLTFRAVFDRDGFKAYCKRLFGVGLYAMLGVLLCAVILIGFNWTMFRTARFDSTSKLLTAERFELVNPSILAFGALSSLNINLGGCFDLYNGPLNYLERPIFFIGIGSLFLIVQGFWKGEKRARRMMLIGFGLIALYMIFPGVMDIFDAFIRNEELGLRSYRLSTLWILLVLFVSAVYGLHTVREKGASMVAAGITGAGLGLMLAGFIALAPQYGITTDRKTLVWTGAMILLWTALCMFLLKKGAWRSKTVKQIAFALTALLMLTDMVGNEKQLVDRSETVSYMAHQRVVENETGYYSGLENALQAIAEEDGDFYRIAVIRTKTIIAYCHPMYFDYHDSSYYANIDPGTYAFLNAVYPVSFRNGLGIKYSRGVGQNPELSELTGYRYMIKSVDSDFDVPDDYVFWQTVGDHLIYRRAGETSIGRTFGTCITRSEFEKLEIEERQRVLLTCIVVDDKIKPIGTIVSSEEAKARLSASAEPDLFRVTTWENDRLEGMVSVTGGAAEKTLLLTVPNVYGWKLKVDGRPTQPQTADLAFIGIPLSPGTHTVKLEYAPGLIPITFCLSFLALAVFIVLAVWKRRKGQKD